MTKIYEFRQSVLTHIVKCEISYPLVNTFPTASMLFRNLILLWLFRFEERRELRNISQDRFSKGRGVGFSDFGMELKNLGSGTMTLTGQMGLSEWNELPICPVVFSHLSDPLVFLTPWSGAKDNAPPLWIRLYKLYSAVLERFSCSKESDKLRFLYQSAR